MRPLDRARAPTAAAGAALYESHYLKAVAPDGGRAVWIRCTADKLAGTAPTGTVWCTWFDAARDAPVARRRTIARPLDAPLEGAWWQYGTTAIGPGHAAGDVDDCAWDLRWSAEADPVPYLPSSRLYDRRVPRSNGVALTPAARFSGRLAVAGEEVDLDGWHGMVGHNWGADHADHWLWLHAAGLEGGAWLDVVLARVRIGPVLTPWLASGATTIGGARQSVGGLAVRPGRVRVQAADDSVAVTVPVGRQTLRLAAKMRTSAVVRWDYDSPDGGGRDVRNCSIADAEVRLGDWTLVLRGRLAIEVGRPAG